MIFVFVLYFIPTIYTELFLYHSKFYYFKEATTRAYSLQRILSNLQSCCDKICILPDAKKLVNRRLDEVTSIHRDVRKNYSKDKVRICIGHTSKSGRYSYSWIVGIHPNPVMKGVVNWHSWSVIISNIHILRRYVKISRRGLWTIESSKIYLTISLLMR